MRYVPEETKPQEPKKEAFRSGYAATAIDKITNILSRRTGMSIEVSDLSLEYENDYGTFSGYLAYVDGGKMALRFNFMLGKSDEIVSVDVYDHIRGYPDYTIENKGSNVVQIVNLVEMALEGDVYYESLRRQKEGRKGFSGEAFMKWVDAEGGEAQNLLQNERISRVYNDYYVPWAERQGDSPLSQSAFTKEANAYLDREGKTNIHSKKGKAVAGSRETQIVDSGQADNFKAAMKLTGDEQFEQLIQYLELMVRGVLNSLYIYGPPGTGKTKLTKDTLKANKAQAKVYAGGVKGTQELVRVLYESRENELLVFDDFDSVFKSKEMINVLKAALQDEEERVITYVVDKRRKKGAVPESFLFTSGIIFISNQPRVDPAIKSRSMVVNINMTQEEMLDRIKSVLGDFMPKVPMEFKLEVYEFLRGQSKNIERIDFRQFKFVLANKLCDKEGTKWQKWSLAMLNA